MKWGNSYVWYCAFFVFLLHTTSGFAWTITTRVFLHDNSEEEEVVSLSNLPLFKKEGHQYLTIGLKNMVLQACDTCGPRTIDLGNGRNFYLNETPAVRNILFHFERARQIVSKHIRLDWLHREFKVVVNSKLGSCDATYDGQTYRFYAETEECRNTATSPSIIYHEYGHGLFQAIVRDHPAQKDNVMDEGVADTLAVHLNGNPKIGLGLLKSDPQNFLRDVSYRKPDGLPRHYPIDVPLNHDKYQESLIFSGAMWELRELLIERYGDKEGNDRSLDIFLKALLKKQTYLEFHDALVSVSRRDKDLIDRAFGDRCLTTDSNAGYCPIR